MYGNEYKKYSPDVRLFCFTLNYYSPRAYEYIRSVFNSNLPAPRTIRYWLSSLDDSPGFTDCAFDALREKASEDETKAEPLVVGLIFDEMATRCQSQYDRSTKTFLGHINAGQSSETDEFSALSKEALVLMVSGINRSFKLPIGYFLSKGLVAHEKEVILIEAMSRLHKAGVVLASITFDGAAGNIAAAKLLGAEFDANKPYFANPFDPTNNVYVLLDPPHMLKLVRNALDRLKIIYDGNGNEIKWAFINELIFLQISQNINLSNKLTKTHAEFHNNKMNVKIAAQTISTSTATAIEFLDTKLKNEKFANSYSTVQFLRVFNNLFDILNAKLNHTDSKYKRPLCKGTIAEFREYFVFVKCYIQGLEVIENGVKKQILQSRSYVPFFGFMHNMTSILGIYDNYIDKYDIDEFYPFSISQDHLELFFGCIRGMGGHNCNPNAQQFAAAYRKLLFQNEVSSSNAANCQNDITKILQVSSAKIKIQLAPDPDELKKLATVDEELFDCCDEALIDGFTHDDELNQHSKAYSASTLEHKVIKRLQLKGKKRCLQCEHVFEENESANDEFIEFLSHKKTVKQPCKSTMKMIYMAEDFLKKFNSVNVTFNCILKHVVDKIVNVPLYESSEFGEQHNHKYELLQCIVETYFDMRSQFLGKLVTRMCQPKLLRHANLKEVHRAGQ